MAGENIDKLIDIVKGLVERQDEMVDRFFGLDAIISGLVLFNIYNTESYEDSLKSANKLKHLFEAVRDNMKKDEDFMKKVNEEIFFSSLNRTITSIEDVLNRLGEQTKRENSND